MSLGLIIAVLYIFRYISAIITIISLIKKNKKNKGCLIYS